MRLQGKWVQLKEGQHPSSEVHPLAAAYSFEVTSPVNQLDSAQFKIYLSVSSETEFLTPPVCAALEEHKPLPKKKAEERSIADIITGSLYGEDAHVYVILDLATEPVQVKRTVNSLVRQYSFNLRGLQRQLLQDRIFVLQTSRGHFLIQVPPYLTLR